MNVTGGNVNFIGSETFTGMYTGSGSGEIVLGGGTMTIGSGGAQFDFPAGQWVWDAGNLASGGDTLTNTGFLTLNNASAVGMSGSSATFVNQNTIVQQGAAG